MAKILIADDDDILVRMYQTKFANEGYTVVTAKNGEDALTKIRSEIPDIILLDIMMPKVNGLDVLQIIKKDLIMAAIPVALLTNVGDSEEQIQKGLSLGAVAYLIKSNYQPAEIVLKIKEILSGYLHKPNENIPDVHVQIKNMLTDKN